MVLCVPEAAVGSSSRNHRVDRTSLSELDDLEESWVVMGVHVGNDLACGWSERS